MAKTVSQFDTIENFRTRYNELATDVGNISGLRTQDKTTLVDAVNELRDREFFYQEFQYVATSSQQNFDGSDSNGNTLKFRQDRVQVFQNDNFLISGTDYSIASPNSDGTYGRITLTSGATASDVITIISFTGSFLNVAAGAGGSSFFQETVNNNIFNTNDSGIILNGSSASQVTELESGFTVQLEGDTFINGDVNVDTGHTFTAPTITDSTATITGGVGTGFSSITSTTFVGNLTGNVTGDLTGDVTGTVSSLANHDTGDLTEGSNLYYTNARADARIAAASIADVSDVNYTTSPTDGQILVWDNANQYWEPTDQNTSDSVTEGSSNLYFTDERAQDAAASMITSATHTDISVTYDDASGTLAFTNTATLSTEEVQDIVGGMVSSNTETNISVSYDDPSGKLNFVVNNLPNSALTNSSVTVNGSSVALGSSISLDTDDIGEGTNQYFTNERVDDRVANLVQVSGNLTKTYDDTAGTLTLNNTYNWAAIDGDGTEVQFADDDRHLKFVSGTGIVANFTDTSTGSSADPFDLDISLDYEIVSSAPSSAAGTSEGHLWFVV